VVRLGFIIGFIALIGAVLSGLAALRVHDQELTVDGIALARAIDVHASLVQERLTERELLARVASGLFRAPAVVKANMLQRCARRSMPSRPISWSRAGSRG
jgi:CHASE1-domain containing sensor protein